MLQKLFYFFSTETSTYWRAAALPDASLSRVTSQGPCREVLYPPQHCQSDCVHLDTLPVLPAGKPASVDPIWSCQSSPTTWVFCVCWHTGGAWLHRDLLPNALFSSPAEWSVFQLQVAHNIQGNDWHGSPWCHYVCVRAVCGIHEWSGDLQTFWNCEAAAARHGNHGGQRLLGWQPCWV